MKIEVLSIINTVRSSEFYGGGKWIEIAKGQNQAVTNFRGMIRKLKRLVK